MRRALAALLCAAAMLGVSAHSAPEYGRTGEPIRLVVGYQPYFTATWSSAVLRAKRYYERYLPPGSSVEFELGIQGGGVITAALLSGHESIGYLGTTPTLTVASTPASDGSRIRIVATASLGHDLCDTLLVRRDAPVFPAPEEALKWIGHRRFAVPYHTCAHAFALQLLRHSAEPRVIVDATPDLISRAFSTGHMDAAVVWEPFASELVQAGLARRAASGATIGLMSGGFIVVREDLLTKRPDVAKAWLRAEFDAQQFLADRRNRQAVVQMIHDQTSGLSLAAIDQALQQAYPRTQAGLRAGMLLPFDVTPAALDALKQTAAALSQGGGPDAVGLPADAARAELAREILRERGPLLTYATDGGGKLQ